MSATFSPSYGWKVTRCDTRIAQPVNDADIAKEEEVGDKEDVDIDMGKESEHSEGDDFEEEGNPNGSDADGSVTIMESKNSHKTRTPIKACWIYPFSIPSKRPQMCWWLRFHGWDADDRVAE